jgi:hypothetical protein
MTPVEFSVAFALGAFAGGMGAIGALFCLDFIYRKIRGKP